MAGSLRRWVHTARCRDRLTFAGLAAGGGQREGWGTAWFWAGHEATVDLALLTDRTHRSWEMSSAEDQPWGWDSPHSGSPWLEVSSEVGRGGAAQCPGQGPGSSEEGPCTFPTHSRPQGNSYPPASEPFHTQALPRLSQQPSEVRFSQPTDGNRQWRGLNPLKSETQPGRMFQALPPAVNVLLPWPRTGSPAQMSRTRACLLELILL